MPTTCPTSWRSIAGPMSVNFVSDGPIWVPRPARKKTMDTSIRCVDTARARPPIGFHFWTPRNPPMSTVHRMGMRTIAAGPSCNLWVPIVMATAQTAVESAIIPSHRAGRARKEREGGASTKADTGPPVVFVSWGMAQAFPRRSWGSGQRRLAFAEARFGIPSDCILVPIERQVTFFKRR
ncbi:hypothetical protein D9M72_472520 [compost metagenome]